VVDRAEDIVGDVVSLDDAAGAPDLSDSAVVDVQFTFFTSGVDDVGTLDQSREAGGVDCDAEDFDECRFVAVGNVEGSRRESEGLVDCFALATEGRGKAKIVGCG